MERDELLARYNYPSFTPDYFEQWMRFSEAPPLGEPAPDFPLWDLNGGETRLSHVWRSHAYTVVEFGSFT